MSRPTSSNALAEGIGCLSFLAFPIAAVACGLYWVEDKPTAYTWWCRWVSMLIAIISLLGLIGTLQPAETTPIQKPSTPPPSFDELFDERGASIYERLCLRLIWMLFSLPFLAIALGLFFLIHKYLNFKDRGDFIVGTVLAELAEGIGLVGVAFVGIGLFNSGWVRRATQHALSHLLLTIMGVVGLLLAAPIVFWSIAVFFR